MANVPVRRPPVRPALKKLAKHWFYFVRNERDKLCPVVSLDFHYHFGPHIALTFDDGPRERYTQEISAWLRDHGLRGTFFMQGRRIREYPDIVRAVDADGHIIGNHGFHHARLDKPTPRILNAEILDTQRLINETLKDRYPDGYPYRLFRPPWGIPWSPRGRRSARAAIAEFLAEHGFQLVLWNADSGDWTWPQPEAIVEQVRRVVDDRQGGALMFHDSHAAVVPALEKLVPEWRRDGYAILDIHELFEQQIPVSKMQLVEIFVVSTLLIEMIQIVSAQMPLG